MGVDGLWELLATTASRQSRLDSLSGEVVAVDTSMWLVQFVKAMRDTEGNARKNAHIEGMLSRICKLLYHGIKPVFVFDGPAPELKRRTIAQRRSTRENAGQNLQRVAEKLLLLQLKFDNLEDMKQALARQSRSEDLRASNIPIMENSSSFEFATDDVLGDNSLTSSDSEEDFAQIKAENQSVPFVGSIEDLDDESLAALPYSVQFEVMEQGKLEMRQGWRREYIESSSDISKYSTLQLRNYLKASEVNQRIDRLRAEHLRKEMSGRMEGGEYAVKSIVSMPETSFILHKEEEVKKRTGKDISQVSTKKSKVEGNVLFGFRGWKCLECGVENIGALIKCRECGCGRVESMAKREKENEQKYEDTIALVVDNAKQISHVGSVLCDIFSDDSGDSDVDVSKVDDVGGDSIASVPVFDINESVVKDVGEQFSTTDSTSNGTDDSTTKVQDSVRVTEDVEIVDLLKVDEDSDVLDDQSHVEEELHPVNSSGQDEDDEPWSSDEVEFDNENENDVGKESSESKDFPRVMEPIDETCKLESENTTDQVQDSPDDITQQLDSMRNSRKNFYKLASSSRNQQEEEDAEYTPLNPETLAQMQQESLQAMDSLRAEQSKGRRDAEHITDTMTDDVLELLKIFGIPYVLSPGEAEAQCAFLNAQNLVKAVVTNDSDVFLFGAKKVYRNLFDSKSFVEKYTSERIYSSLGLDRERLIHLGMLLGSDYTEGINGIGIVNALEVLNAFPGWEGLKEFRDWVFSPGKSPDSSQDKDKQLFKVKHETIRRNWSVSRNFPSEAVYKAYSRPQLDQSLEPFAWGKLNRVELDRFLCDKLGLTVEEVDRRISPVLSARSSVQTRVDQFFTSEAAVAEIRSVRLKHAVKGLLNKKAES